VRAGGKGDSAGEDKLLGKAWNVKTIKNGAESVGAGSKRQSQRIENEPGTGDGNNVGDETKLGQKSSQSREFCRKKTFNVLETRTHELVLWAISQVNSIAAEAFWSNVNDYTKQVAWRLRCRKRREVLARK